MICPSPPSVQVRLDVEPGDVPSQPNKPVLSQRFDDSEQDSGLCMCCVPSCYVTGPQKTSTRKWVPIVSATTSYMCILWARTLSEGDTETLPVSLDTLSVVLRVHLQKSSLLKAHHGSKQQREENPFCLTARQETLTLARASRPGISTAAAASEEEVCWFILMTWRTSFSAASRSLFTLDSSSTVNEHKWRAYQWGVLFTWRASCLKTLEHICGIWYLLPEKQKPRRHIFKHVLFVFFLLWLLGFNLFKYIKHFVSLMCRVLLL